MAQSDTTNILEAKPNPVVALWRHALVQAFLNDPITLISGSFLVVVLLAVIFAPLVAPYDPQDQQLRLRHSPPFSTGTATIRTVDTSCRGNPILHHRY